MPANSPPLPNVQLPPWLRSVLCVLAALAVTVGGPARAASSIACPLADGFDFPVGKPDAVGYYKARGFWPNGHLGEDWNGRGGGNTDLGDPVYSIADGVVVLSRDVKVGWGHVVIIRHAYRDKSGKVILIDSLYGHLDVRLVRLNQKVKRGQKIGTIGTGHGRYYAHLHFEIRKNLQIGMNRSQFAKTYANYHSPTPFIQAHRQLQTSRRPYPIPLRTFAPYGKTLASMRKSDPDKNSIVPLRGQGGHSPAPRNDGKLKPELQEALDDTVGKDEADEELGSFWKRLKTKFKSPKEKAG